MNYDDIKICLIDEVSLLGTIDGIPMKISEVVKYGKKSKLFRCIGLESEVSDFCTHLSGFSYDYYFVSTIKNDFIYFNAVGSNGDKHYSNYANIRPVLSLSDSLYKELLKKSHVLKNGIREVEFGEYPQKLILRNDENKLFFKEATYRKTGNKYTINDRKINKLRDSKEFIPLELEEYIYNGKKFVIYGKSFYEVKPIVWLIDEDRKQLISKYSIVSDIPLKGNVKYYGPHDDYEKFTFSLDKYLSEYLLKEILQNEKNKDLNNENESEDKTIIEKEKLENEILKYLNKFKSKKLNDKFDHINSVFSNESKKTMNNSQNKEIKLMLDYSKELSSIEVYNNYISELNKFLEFLKEKDFLYDIIEEIKKCIFYVENGNTKSEDEFYKDINTLLVLYDKLDFELKTKNKNLFIDKLNKDINDIYQVIEGNTNIILGYSNIKEWKNNFRYDFQALIMQFKSDYDLQVFKHTVDSKEKIVDNFKNNQYAHTYKIYCYLQKILLDIKENIRVYGEQYNIDFTDINSKLIKFDNIDISYYKSNNNLSEEITNLILEALNLQFDVNEIINDYKYDICKIELK